MLLAPYIQIIKDAKKNKDCKMEHTINLSKITEDCCLNMYISRNFVEKNENQDQSWNIYLYIPSSPLLR